MVATLKRIQDFDRRSPGWSILYKLTRYAPRYQTNQESCTDVQPCRCPGAGVYRPGNRILYVKNNLNTGFADHAMVLGVPGDQGVAGDWTGQGYDTVGVYRASAVNFYLSNRIGDGPINGDIAFQYGKTTDVAITGDWIGQGHDGVGTFRPSNGQIYLKNALTTGFADTAFIYGVAGDQPVAGHWQAVYPPVAPASILIAKTAAPVAVPNNASVPSGNQIGG